MALRHAREQRSPGAGDLQRQRLHDPARVRRGAVHARRARGGVSPRPRPSSPSSSPATWSALYLAQVRGTKFGDEISADHRAAGPHPGAGGAGAGDRWSRSATLARSLAEENDGALPRPARGLPGGAGRRAEAQGTGLHARGGLRGGELKHGPIALIEDGLPVVVVVPSREGRACCTTRSSPTSRRSGRGARGPS